MAKGKKISMINIIVLAVLVVCLVLAIVGLSVDKWTDVKVNEDIQDSIFRRGFLFRRSGRNGD